MTRIIHLLFCLTFISCNTTNSHENAPAPSEINTTVNNNVPQFDADSAYAYIARQVDFGPRVPNTEAHKRCGAYLTDELKRFGAETYVQEVSLTAWDKTKLQSKNIIGAYNTEKKERILLFAHWDSRPYADHDPDKANIDNVRLGGIVISAKPPQNSDLIFNVGAAVGNCQGRINNIRFAGNIKVEVATTETKREIGTVNVGGVIGQLTSSGHLSQVARMEEETPGTLTVISSCPNTTNDRNTGGLVGLSNGRIEDCTLTHTTVDASNTCGTMVYTGGLAGMARGTQGSHETTTNGIFRCKFDGTIKCGLAYSEDHGDDSAEGHAYAGGAVGYAYWVDGIEENEISGTLYEPSDDSATGGFKPYENSIYATGGLFGQAFESPTSNNTTWINFENVYEGTSPNYFKGKIAGRADANSTADSNQSHTPGELEDIGDEITSGDLPGEN